MPEDSNIIRIVSDTYTAWTERDMPSLFANIDPDIVYVLHLDPAVVTMGGEYRGRPAFEAY